MTPRLLTSATGGSASGPVSFGRWNDLSLVLSADTHPPEQAIVSGSSMSLHTWNLSSGSRPSTAPTHNCYSGSVAAAYERRSLGIGSHWLFESWGRFLPEYTTRSACSTCSCTGLSGSRTTYGDTQPSVIDPSTIPVAEGRPIRRDQAQYAVREATR